MNLTPRETQVADGVRRGLSNKQIATEAGLCEGTVKVYLVRVFQKAGVGSRIELAMKLARCPECGAGMGRQASA